MAYFLKKNRFKSKRRYLDRISRIPFNNETVEPYIVSPSVDKMKSELIGMLRNILNREPSCVDGQNGNLMDNYIESWKGLAKTRLDAQRVDHAEKISILSNSRESIKTDAQKWLEFETKELESIEKQLEEMKKDYYVFLSNQKPKHKEGK